MVENLFYPVDHHHQSINIQQVHPISNFGISSNLTNQIENPITNLQEYCKANMLPIDIKTEVCDPDPKNTDKRKL